MSRARARRATCGGSKVSEEKSVSGEQPAGEQSKVDEYLERHVKRWHHRVQIIVAITAVFLLYMIWFMMHE